MNNISKRFFKQRIGLLALFLVAAIIGTSIYSSIYNSKNIVKSNFTVFVDNDTEEIFKYQFNNNKGFYKYYTYEKTSDLQNADFIFTSNIEKINSSKDYSIEGYSPLVVCFKNNENLNNYLKTSTDKGFLTCNSSKDIQNKYSDAITCNFLRIIEVIINSGDWSDLGGEDKKITVYCPETNTIAGNLFYDFLLITINNGKYPTDNLEQVKEKANMFLSSPSTIQTDVKSKISKLGGTLKEEDIYVLFEADLISATSGKGEISVTYPETTVIKQIYLQYNNLDLQDSISENFSEGDWVWDGNSLSYNLNKYFYFRNSIYPNFKDTAYTDNHPKYFNLQEGFNYYELAQ